MTIEGKPTVYYQAAIGRSLGELEYVVYSPEKCCFLDVYPCNYYDKIAAQEALVEGKKWLVESGNWGEDMKCYLFSVAVEEVENE